MAKTSTVKAQEAKRRRVVDLLSTHVDISKIVTIFGVSRRTVYRVKDHLTAGTGINRKLGSCNSSPILTPEFLEVIKAKIDVEPYKLMRKTARELKIDPKTMRNAVKKLGYESYIIFSCRIVLPPTGPTQPKIGLKKTLPASGHGAYGFRPAQTTTRSTMHAVWGVLDSKVGAI